MVAHGLEASSAYIAGCVCAAAAGAFLATQSGINSTLGSLAGRSFASVVSFAVGLAALVVFFLVDVYGLGNKGPDRHSVAAAPWWAWTGGLLGAFYVAVVIIFVRTLGAATLMAIFVTAQLSTAVALDALGWVGLRRRPLHWARIAGLILMIGGVALVTYFDGSRGVRGAASPATAAAASAATGGTAPAATAAGPGAQSKVGDSDSDPLLPERAPRASDGAGFGVQLPAAEAEVEGRSGATEDDAPTRRLLGGGSEEELGREAEGEGGGGDGGGGGGDVELALRGRRGALSSAALPSG
ncbi:hypothetical protein PLESTB_000134000 [Pleodorina starrii]|uniref:Uncharacterized protein n=1 Tax=Pleodorina starrii TaxID=330485 RepID=A0A9W6EXJ6_9CHLO|nr:hypothetical protein PLESTM_002077900 [Pleodorina starrii]GLC48762.1 hypothetical protein PLESTB_000134000 [Pleodorina starrii]GLC74307.1 hypothetical protein PLESTF_001487400 [Pleodorina starrii]